MSLAVLQYIVPYGIERCLWLNPALSAPPYILSNTDNPHCWRFLPDAGIIWTA